MLCAEPCHLFSSRRHRTDKREVIEFCEKPFPLKCFHFTQHENREVSIEFAFQWQSVPLLFWRELGKLSKKTTPLWTTPHTENTQRAGSVWFYLICSKVSTCTSKHQDRERKETRLGLWVRFSMWRPKTRIASPTRLHTASASSTTCMENI